MQCTVQSIFQGHFTDYAAVHGLPGHYFTAARAIMSCRTAQLGGHVETCSNGHVLGVWYNSCRHRRCPQCNFLQVDRWLEKQKRRLLATAHRHVIFTIPHEFHALWLFNTALMIDALFKASRDTVMELSRDKKYMGATPRFLSALHTWGRSLCWHPHIHCLITEGGVDEQGQWRQPRRNSFLPARVVIALFRGKFLAEIGQALQQGTFVLPPDTGATQIQNLINKLGRDKWNVKIMERYAHGDGVARYLARYVRGGPINNKQLSDTGDGHINFRYWAHENGKKELHHMRLTPQQFVARYLIHVPPKGKMVVRGYGPYAPTERETLNTLHEKFKQAPVTDEPNVNWETAYERKGAKPLPSCPTCQQPRRLGHPVAPKRRWWALADPPAANPPTEEKTA